jgi:hypothetical protein
VIRKLAEGDKTLKEGASVATIAYHLTAANIKFIETVLESIQ